MERELLNLYVGDRRPPDILAQVAVGPWTVELVPEYEARVTQLSRNRAKTTTLSPHGEPTVSWSPPRGDGGWTATAVARKEADQPIEPSLFGREPPVDDGLWDLCTLLTLLTGRRVTTREHAERWSSGLALNQASFARSLDSANVSRSSMQAWAKAPPRASSALSHRFGCLWSVAVSIRVRSVVATRRSGLSVGQRAQQRSTVAARRKTLCQGFQQSSL